MQVEGKVFDPLNNHLLQANTPRYNKWKGSIEFGLTFFTPDS
jgi:hypothetical protein